jgi:hypothetical protein
MSSRATEADIPTTSWRMIERLKRSIVYIQKRVLFIIMAKTLSCEPKNG